jgi:hypothetical protein
MKNDDRPVTTERTNQYGFRETSTVFPVLPDPGILTRIQGWVGRTWKMLAGACLTLLVAGWAIVSNWSDIKDFIRDVFPHFSVQAPLEIDAHDKSTE